MFRVWNTQNIMGFVWKRRPQVVRFSTALCVLKVVLPHWTWGLTHTCAKTLHLHQKIHFRNLQGHIATVSRQESKGPGWQNTFPHRQVTLLRSAMHDQSLIIVWVSFIIHSLPLSTHCDILWNMKCREELKLWPSSFEHYDRRHPCYTSLERGGRFPRGRRCVSAIYPC